MIASNDAVEMEYESLMSRSRQAERMGELAWMIGMTAAAFLLGWGIRASSPGLMLSVVFAAAVGFYPLISARQLRRLTDGYVEEFMEGKGSGAQWNSRLAQLRLWPTVNPLNDWTLTGIANLSVLAAIVFAWMFAKPIEHGEAIAAMVTACGVAFAFHSITETSRVERTDFVGVWHKVGTGPREVERSRSSIAS